jgi:F-type H+-transporting ATPase subunit b
MDVILRQLGGYLLGAIPTMVLLLVVFAVYRALVHGPLARVLAEYEQRLREARVALFKAQEARRKKALEARTAALAEARARAQQQVQEARAALERDKVSAQDKLQVEAGRLAEEIIRVILRPATAAQNPVAGGRP